MGEQENAVGPPDAAALVEREGVLAAVQQGWAAAQAGEPAAVLLEGAAGSGKTSVLEATAQLARQSDALVLGATCSQLESDFPFAVVRQLLGYRARGVTAPVPAAAAGAEPFAVLDMFYWAVVDLADEQPVVLLVDDVHWADDPSLRWLHFLVRRLGGIRLLPVMATRPVESTRPLLSELAAVPVVQRVPVPPLSLAGSARLLQGRVGGQIPDDLVGRCHGMSDGNPFYLTAIARAVREEGAERVADALADSSVPLPEVVRLAVLDRLRALGPDVVAVVRAVAVLGADADAPSVAALAEIPEDRVRVAVAGAVHAGLLRPGPPLAAEHPLVHAAVYADLSAAERTRLHKEAARQLAGAGAEPERVATHLLATDPSDDIWVVESLVAGARRAVRRGAPETACRYLRRAQREPLAHRSVAVLLELGAAELLAGEVTAAQHLQDAVALAQEDGQLAQAADLLARALVYAGRVPEAVDVLLGARDRLRDPAGERAIRLDLAAISTGHLDVRTTRRADELLAAYERWSGERPVDRLVMAHLSLEPARWGSSAQEAVARARVALADGRLLVEEGADAQTYYLPILALFLSDALDEARRHLDAAVEQARSRASLLGFCLAAAWRSHVALRAGDVVSAGSDAEAVLIAAGSAGLHLLTPYSLAFLTDALVERGELDRAAALWREHHVEGDLPPVLPSNYLLFSRGCLRLAQGRAAEAAADLLDSGERQQQWAAPGVGFWPWRSRAALACAREGDVARARRLAQDEIGEARRFGAPRPLGMALHAAALLEHGPARAAGLEQAHEVLAASPARLEHARVCVDLGAVLVRTGARAAGVRRLEEGLQHAWACGGSALVARAQAELVATGLSPRRAGLQGVDALTISERRVAQLAAEGHTNRQIAQSLFVTPKTVETHLARAFRKLGVSSRGELAEALSRVSA